MFFDRFEFRPHFFFLVSFKEFGVGARFTSFDKAPAYTSASTVALLADAVHAELAREVNAQFGAFANWTVV